MPAFGAVLTGPRTPRDGRPDLGPRTMAVILSSGLSSDSAWRAGALPTGRGRQGRSPPAAPCRRRLARAARRRCRAPRRTRAYGAPGSGSARPRRRCAAPAGRSRRRRARRGAACRMPRPSRYIASVHWPPSNQSASVSSAPPGVNHARSLTPSSPGRPRKNADCRNTGCSRRSRTQRRGERQQVQRVLRRASQRSHDSCVVLAVGVVVAALRAAHLVAHASASARRSTAAASSSRLRACRRRSALTPASSVSPSTPQFQDRLSRRRRGCPRRWPRCACGRTPSGRAA